MPQILAKVEMLNPGGSVKDRVALQIVQEAIAEGRLRPGGLITEGTAGDSVPVSHATFVHRMTCSLACSWPAQSYTVWSKMTNHRSVSPTGGKVCF